MNKLEKINFINNFIKNKANTYVKDYYDFYLKIDFDNENNIKNIEIKKFEEKESDKLGYINKKLKIFFTQKVAELLISKIKNV